MRTTKANCSLFNAIIQVFFKQRLGKCILFLLEHTKMHCLKQNIYHTHFRLFQQMNNIEEI